MGIAHIFHSIDKYPIFHSIDTSWYDYVTLDTSPLTFKAVFLPLEGKFLEHIDLFILINTVSLPHRLILHIL